MSDDKLKNRIRAISSALREYDGPDVKIMEVCGSHTAAIVKSGIPAMLSPKIHLISGPGCPVCVTVTAYIDRLVELSMEKDTIVYAFGDLLRVRGSSISLADAKAAGGQVQMVYAPSELLEIAKKEPDKRHVFAAVGFETTAPAYALLLEEAERQGLDNIQLLTSLKTMPEVIRWLCEADQSVKAGDRITGFLAPGHVCAVTGYEDYERLAAQYGLPFVVSGFSGPSLLASIYGLVKLRGQGEVRNFYPQVVKREGNLAAQKGVLHYFEPVDAAWRGMGVVAGSGMALRGEYAHRDAGSRELLEDHVHGGCRCADVLRGRITPSGCPLYGSVCTPEHPNGACMVSQEGSCFNWYVAGRR